MPPRFAYWTILVGGLPTAFRAAERAELLPTFKRLLEKHPDAVMQWFSRGKLWESPEAAREALIRERTAERPRERGRDWRPGGEHRDPRQKFIDAKKARNQDRRKQRFERRNRDEESGPGRTRPVPPSGPPHPTGAARPDGPQGWKDRPRGPKPEARREWKDRPAGPKPEGRREWKDRPAGPKPEGRREWKDRPAGPKPEGRREWKDRPAGPKPEGRREWKDRPRGPRPPGKPSGGPGTGRPSGPRPARPSGHSGPRGPGGSGRPSGPRGPRGPKR